MKRKQILLGAALLVWPVVLVDPNGAPMIDPALLVSMRLVDAGTFTLTDHLTPAVVFETVSFDISAVDGKVYAGVGPGASVLAAPIYFVLQPLFALFSDDVSRSARVKDWYGPNSKKLGREISPHFKNAYLLQIAMTWLLIAPLWVFFLVRLYTLLTSRGGIHQGGALAIVLTVGLGSLALYYGSMYSRQMLSALLGWHAALSLLKTGQLRAREALLAGAGLGLCIAVDYSSVLFVVLTLGFWLPKHNRKVWAWVAAPLLVCGGLLAAFHTACFGGPFSTPYQHRFWITGSSPEHLTLDLSDFEKGLFVGINLPSLNVMIRLLLGPYKGLFVYSPVLAMAAYGHTKTRRGRLAIYCIAVCVVYLLFNSSMGTHLEPPYDRMIWGGLSPLWGPRHLLIIMPALAWGLSQLDWHAPTTRVAIAMALGLSMAFNMLGVMFRVTFISTAATAPELQVPVAHALDLLLAHGPRVPLLHVYGTSSAVQTIVLTGAALTSGLLAREWWRSETAASGA